MANSPSDDTLQWKETQNSSTQGERQFNCIGSTTLSTDHILFESRFAHIGSIERRSDHQGRAGQRSREKAFSAGDEGASRIIPTYCVDFGIEHTHIPIRRTDHSVHLIYHSSVAQQRRQNQFVRSPPTDLRQAVCGRHSGMDGLLAPID